MNFALIQHHKWNLDTLENMVPWERDVYIALLIQYLDEKKKNEQRLAAQVG